MKTILNTEIPTDVRGILYLCILKKTSIEVIKQRMYVNAGNALDAYANIPNPESQLVIGKDYEELIANLEALHKNMKDAKWIEELHNCI